MLARRDRGEPQRRSGPGCVVVPAGGTVGAVSGTSSAAAVAAADGELPAAPPEPTDSAGRWWSDPVRVGLVVLTAAAFAFSLWSLANVYPHLTSNNDEAVYVFQAELFGGGQATLPLEQAQLTRPWMSGEQAGRLIMVFPPTWPVLLALGDALFGSSAVVAALVVASLVPLGHLLGRGLTGDRLVGLVTALGLSLSPMVLIHGATRLSYLFALALELAIAGLVVRSARYGWRVRELVGAGFAAGVLFSARPFDSILYAAAVAVLVGGLAWTRTPTRSRLRTLGAILGWVAAGALLPILAVLAYNDHLSGNPLRFPLHAVGGENAFGFGPRRIVDGSPLFDVTPSMAASALRLNLGELPHWIWGGVLALPFMAWGFVVVWRRDRAGAGFLAALTLVVPMGFFFYWGNVLIVQGRAELGPHYYLALLIPGAVTVAAALVDLGRRWGPTSAVALVVVLTFVTVVVELPGKYERAERVTASSEADLAAVAAATGGRPSVVIVPASPDGSWILHPRGHLANRPDLDGDVVYVAETGPSTFDLFDRFAGRAVHRLTGRQPDSSMTRPPDAMVVPVEVLSAPSFDLDLDVTNTDGEPVVTAYVQTAAGGQLCVLDTASSAGRQYRLTWWFDGQGSVLTSSCPTPAEVIRPSDGALVAGASFGDDAQIADQARVDQRTVYRPAADRVDLLWPPEVRRFDPSVVAGRAFDTTHERDDPRLAVTAHARDRRSPAG
jgi:hypothetical protein